jgi:hypothetical protein
MSRLAILTATLLWLATSALASHDHPRKAKLVDVWLVQAFTDCLTPSLTHDSPLNLPACPSSNVSATKSFGPSGWGHATYKVLPGPAGNGTASATDLKVKARLSDVLDGGVPVVSGSLDLSVFVRITDHGCAGLPCTSLAGYLTVSVPCGSAGGLHAGECRVTTTINTALTGQIVGYGEANVEFGQVQVLDGSDVVFVQGTYWP